MGKRTQIGSSDDEPFIAALERASEEGNAEFIAENMPRLKALISQLEDKRGELATLQRRALELRDKDEHRGFVAAATALFSVAQDVSQVAQARPAQMSPGSAMAALVFAAASLEAFINEAFEVAHMAMRANSDEPGAVQDLSDLGKLLVRQTSTPMELQVARLVFGHKLLDMGKSAYQDLAFLFRLRNELVHLKPSGHYTGDAQGGIRSQTQPKWIEGGFRPRGLWSPPIRKPDRGFHWSEALKTPDTELWACKTWKTTVDSFVQVLPPGVFKDAIEGIRQLALQGKASPA